MQHTENSMSDRAPQSAAVSRRHLLRGLQIGGGVIAGSMALTSRVRAAAPSGSAPPFLLQIYLRGGADGLTLLCPYADSTYGSLRSETRVLPPGTGGGTPEREAIDLGVGNVVNGTTFGVPKALSGLKTLYDAGDLAFLHSVGNLGGPQSHFAAQDIMEQGAGAGLNLPGTGWIARHLNATAAGPFRAMTYRTILSVSLFGAPSAAPVADPLDFGFPEVPVTGGGNLDAVLQALYAADGPPLGDAYAATVEAETILSTAFGTPPTGGGYPTSPFGAEMRNIARIAQATDLEAVTVSTGSWDTHTSQGGFAQGGQLYDLMKDLNDSLVAFHQDMASHCRDYVVVVISEFGRQAQENANAGTDHGKGGVAMVMGPRVNGQQISGGWAGLGNLDGGDVKVETDVRDILFEVLRDGLHRSQADAVDVFNGPDPGWMPTALNLIDPTPAPGCP